MTKKERTQKLQKLIDSQEYFVYFINFGTFKEPQYVKSIPSELINEGFIKLIGNARYDILMTIISYLKTDGTAVISQLHIEQLTGISRHVIAKKIFDLEKLNIFTISKTRCPTTGKEINCYIFNNYRIIYHEEIENIEFNMDDSLDFEN